MGEWERWETDRGDIERREGKREKESYVRLGVMQFLDVFYLNSLSLEAATTI